MVILLLFNFLKSRTMLTVFGVPKRTKSQQRIRKSSHISCRENVSPQKLFILKIERKFLFQLCDTCSFQNYSVTWVFKQKTKRHFTQWDLDSLLHESLLTFSHLAQVARTLRCSLSDKIYFHSCTPVTRQVNTCSSARLHIQSALMRLIKT